MTGGVKQTGPVLEKSVSFERLCLSFIKTNSAKIPSFNLFIYNLCLIKFSIIPDLYLKGTPTFNKMYKYLYYNTGEWTDWVF